MNLNTEQQLLVETKLNNEKKSTVVAYLLLIFLGWLGIHNFYVNRFRLACCELGIFIFIVMTILGGGKNFLEVDSGAASFFFTLLAYGLLFICIVFDFFTLYGVVKKDTNKKRNHIIAELQGKNLPESEISTNSKLINLGIILAFISAAIALNVREFNVAKNPDQYPIYEEQSSIIGNHTSQSNNQLEELARATESEIDPYGQIVEYFSSTKLTDLQKQELQKSVHGNIVVWTLPVAELAELFGEYQFTLYDRRKESVRVEFTLDPKKILPEEISLIKNLKIGEYLTVKGKIDYAGYASRSVFLKPVMLWDIGKEKKYAKEFGEIFPNLEIYNLKNLGKGSKNKDTIKNVFKIATSQVEFLDPSDVFSNIEMAENSQAKESYLNKIQGKIVEWTLPIDRILIDKENKAILFSDTATEEGKFYPYTMILLASTDDTLKQDIEIIKSLKRHGFITIKGILANNSGILSITGFISYPEQIDAIKRLNAKVNQN